MDADYYLALSDEGSGSFVGDDLEVVGLAGVEEVDGRGGPVSSNEGPLFLPHGRVVGVVVPGIAESVELSLKLVGDSASDLPQSRDSARAGFGPCPLTSTSQWRRALA